VPPHDRRILIATLDRHHVAISKERLVKKFNVSVCLVFVALVVLLALPIAQTASPVAAKPRRGTVTRTFANRAPIELPVAAKFPLSADLYPSEITVDGLKKGRIRDVNVRLNDIDHPFPDDVQMLLVGPEGQTAIVMANSGGGFDLSGVTLTLDDEAAASLPMQQQIESGRFRPTNIGNDEIEFNGPAPVASANAALTVFDGGNPNGTWRLYVQDKIGDVDGGVLAGGWALEIEARVKHSRDKKR
jgi:subtilisin-like proprotein convertase family protein